MIMKDFRYIIKRIFIGLGIIIGLSFIKSCNVYALEDTSDMQLIHHNPNYFSNEYYLYYDSINNRIYGQRKKNNVWYEQSFNIPDGYNYLSLIGSPNNLNIGQFYLSNNIPYINSSNQFAVPSGTSRYAFDISWSTQNNFVWTYNYSSGFISSNYNPTSVKYYINYDLKNYNNDILQQKNLDINLGVQVPEIVSLNPTLNTDEDVLISVSFAPEFSLIDTVNYKYYAWFDGYNKFQIIENNIPFNTRNNTTFYVEIVDLEGNTIDSQTYTVSRIGQFDYSEYDILFSVETYTESDTLNEQKPIDYINRVDIDITFMPKSAYLKYQYQFVNEGDSITNNWITINSESSSDLSKNNFVYTTHDNGTLYTQILDSEDNFLYSETYTITSIGMVKYYANDTGVGGFFNKITDKLDYSGPISSLISVPIRLFSSLLTESSKSCTSYSFGTLLGSEITFSCVNVENYIGSNLYNLLDLLMSFGVVLGIIHFIKKQYSNFMSMNDKTDDIM